MIDIRLIREEIELVKKSCKDRGYDIDVDEIVELDKEWRILKKNDDDLRGERNKISEEINQAKKAKNEKKAQELIIKAKEIPEKLAKNEEKEKALKAEIDDLISRIPNIQRKEVPIGDAEKNKEIKKWGKPTTSKNAKTHLELGEALDIIDMKRATKISGAGFYILKIYCNIYGN